MSRYRPSLEEFLAAPPQAPRAPIYRQLTADALTPVSAFRRIERGAPSFLFESVVGGERVGRYSFLGSEPFCIFEARGLEISVTDVASGHSVTHMTADPLLELERLLARYMAAPAKGLPRFTGGAVGYAAYDAVRYIERLPNAPPDDRGLPDLLFALYDRMVLFDHIRKTVLVVAHARLDEEPPEAAYHAACARIDELVARLVEPSDGLAPVDIETDLPITLEPASNFTRDRYEQVVRQCQEYIKAGDIFQVVPSQRFLVETKARPFDVYRVLRVVNPSPFLFYLPFDGFSLIGSSP